MVGRWRYWLWLRSSTCSRTRLPMPLVSPRSLLLDISSCCSAVQRPTTRGTLVRRLPLQSRTCSALNAPSASGSDCRRLRARHSTCTQARSIGRQQRAKSSNKHSSHSTADAHTWTNQTNQLKCTAW